MVKQHFTVTSIQFHGSIEWGPKTIVPAFIRNHIGTLTITLDNILFMLVILITKYFIFLIMSLMDFLQYIIISVKITFITKKLLDKN